MSAHKAASSAWIKLDRRCPRGTLFAIGATSVYQRAFLGEVKGVYFLRADVALLSEGLHQWPRDITGYHGISRDRLCFLWKTSCQKLGPNCVNDIIFYVPSTLFHCFREALSQAKEDHMPTGHLHWLSLCPALADLGRSCVARIQLDAPGEHILGSWSCEGRNHYRFETILTITGLRPF